MNNPSPMLNKRSSATKDSFIVIGGGILGMASAERLIRDGYAVTVVESGKELGGLTATQILRSGGRDVVCDKFYHVLLESDSRLLAKLEDLEMKDRVRWTSANATIVKDGNSYPATSLVDMARLPALSKFDRARVAASVILSVGLPSPLASKLTSRRWLGITAGRSALENFWDPLLRAKLGSESGRVSATFITSTFQRLIKARLKGSGDRFGVLPNGYQDFFAHWRSSLENLGVTFATGSSAVEITGHHPRIDVHLADGQTLSAGGVICTVAGPIIQELIPDDQFAPGKQEAPYLGVICTTLLLKQPPNDSYITYLVNDVGLTGIIGMHALLPPSVREHGAVVYLPRYCAPDDPWFSESDDVLIERMVGLARSAMPDANWDYHDAQVHRARHVVPLPIPKMQEPRAHITSTQGLYILSSAQNTTGTLNVEGSLALAQSGLDVILKAHLSHLPHQPLEKS